MKNLALILLIAISIGCKKESADPIGPAIQGKKLTSITTKNKIEHSFQYENNLLVKENYYSFCETNPTEEFSYEYNNSQLSMIKTTSRMMYSSTSALCNPALGIKSEETFEYNANGKVVKTIRSTVNTTSGKTTIEYVYNSKGYIEKQTILGGQTPLATTFEYDNKGNLIKETSPDGQVANYEYDDKTNPYYLMNLRPAWISAFNKSPNNVIRATGRYNFVRTFKYDADGYPIELSEDNGVTYKYNYE